MADSDGGGKKWLGCGCLGCVGLIVIVLLGLGGVFGTAWFGVRNEQVAQQSFEPAIEPAATVEQVTPGRVVLRLASGEFHVKPAKPGEPLRVEANFDKNSYALTEEFRPGEDGWTYEVALENKGSMLMSLLKAMVGGTSARVDVFLPPDIPLDLELDISRGGAEVDLGGLWLKTVAIDFEQGGFAVTVSEPLREPLESLSIEGQMGGFAAVRLGDASPRKLLIDSRMGGMDVDLRGEWLVDSEITVRQRQGGGSIRLPRDVNIVGIDSHGLALGGDDEVEVPRPTLTFSIDADEDDLEIVD